MQLPKQLPALDNIKAGLKAGLGRRGGTVVGLDIQPGFAAAVEARVNGSVFVEKAAAIELAPDTLRDGEVNNDEALSEALRELFKDSGMGKRVRIGIANQRTVLRTLELPPVTDDKELAAAVNFQAQEQVPMPLNNAVLDFHALGVIDTPSGPRQRVVLVAAQRDMVERLLGAVENAGLIAEGIDLSAFALIRSLYVPVVEASEHAQRVLYLNVDGLTNLAIAEGTVCRFTRVVGGGIEAMAAELAAKRQVTAQEARALLFAANLSESEQVDEPDAAYAAPQPQLHGDAPTEPQLEDEPAEPLQGAAPPASGELAPTGATATAAEVPAAQYGDGDGAGTEAGYPQEMPFDEAAFDDSGFDDSDLLAAREEEVWTVLESGIRNIYGEVRNSLDFHRSQDGGGEVSHIVLSGAAQDIPGFRDALESALGLEVKSRQAPAASGDLHGVSPNRLAVAAGLAFEEISQ